MAEASRNVRTPSVKTRTETPASDVGTTPGEIVEQSDNPSVQRYNTLVDIRPPTKNHQDEGGHVEVPDVPPESMVDQEEIDFPLNTEKSFSSTQSINNEHSNKNEKPDGGWDTKDYEIDVDEESEPVIESPPTSDTLPDLHQLMATLEEDVPTDDNSIPVETPPSLFSHPEYINNYKKINDLRLQVEDEEIEDYIRQFELEIKDDVLMIGSIGLEDVQEEEKRLRDEHIRYIESEAQWEEERKRRIRMFEEQAKRRAAYALWKKRKEIQKIDQLQQQKERLMLDRLQMAFQRAENHLINILEKRKGEVKTYYGDLMMADGYYGGSQGRRWKVDWDKTPQPVQVKLKCLRGVKDKLPGGRYVLIVSLYDRLGGHVMRWSKLKGQQWGGATMPVTHEGHFYNTEVKLNQSVFTVLPAKPGIRPGMVLMFELFLLRGAVLSSDRVVAWGAFPIADGQFEVIEGKYKCPMLRGEMDTRIEKHEKLESLLASDLDHWMCNLYFEVVKLPRYLAGQKEYEVELQFSSGILAYPDRIVTGEEIHDGEEPVSGSLPDMSVPEKISSTSSHANVSSGSSADIPIKKLSSDDDLSSIYKTPAGVSTDGMKKISLDVINGKENKGLRHRRLYSTISSRMADPNNKMKVCDESDTDDDDDVIEELRKDYEYFPVKEEEGLFYKKHTFRAIDMYHKKLFTMLPDTQLMAKQRKQKRKLTHVQELEEYSFSVSKDDDVWKRLKEKGRLSRQGWQKLQYLRRQLLAELGLSQWRSREFWGMILMFILVFFIRIYIHYGAQWVLLQGLQLPVNKFNFLPYTVELNYQATLLRSREEIGMVLVGPSAVIIIFVILVLVSWITQKLIDSFPDIGSKFIMAFGFQAFLDPLLIMIVDMALKRYLNQTGTDPIADCAKLYWHFYRSEGSGLAGIFITIFLYLFIAFTAGVILYMYFLRLHNNGRMLDVYWRLHGDDDVFFIPHDYEISNQELAYIVKKAEQWRGEEGERRKVAVYDYIWEEEMIEDSVWEENDTLVISAKGHREKTTHVSIHTLHLDGLRELYRHFLRLPDGAIIEVFGDLSLAGVGRELKVAVEEQSQKLGNPPEDVLIKNLSGQSEA